MKTFKYFCFFSFLMATLPFSAAADTIFVRQADLVGPIVMKNPFMQNGKNRKGDSFDNKEFLQKNRHLIFSTRTDGKVEQGCPLTSIDKSPTLRCLRFKVETQNYTKAKLNVSIISNVVVFANGSEIKDPSNVVFEPGETTVSLLCLTKEESKDTFQVRIEGKNLNSLKINSSEKHLFSHRDILLGKHYAGLNISPCGQYISYKIYETFDDGSSAYETYLKETSTQKVIEHRMGNVNYDWLPKRDVLYFTQKLGKTIRLMVRDPRTGEENVLSENIPDGHFDVSPTEDFLIYNVQEEGLKDKDGTLRFYDPEDQIPNWRKRSSLFLFHLKTGEMQRLTFGSESCVLDDISSDGRKLLISFRESHPEMLPSEMTTSVLMDVETGKTDTLFVRQPYVTQIQFSPSDNEVLITAAISSFNRIGSTLSPDKQPNAYDYRLFLLDIATKNVQPLLKNFSPSVSSAVWSKGDRQIYFTANDKYDVSLFRLNVEKNSVSKLDLPLTYIQLFSISPYQKTPTCIYTGQTGSKARDLYVVNLAAKVQTRQIGEISSSILSDNAQLPTCKDWSFQSSRGDSIYGFYFLPANFDAARKYPMIVYYYGGCMPTVKTLESYYPFAAFANRGYVVYVVEPSGAIGFGEEFGARHVNTWGDESSQDIIEGVEHFVEEHPYVDKKHIGCLGASYGGFMTQYLQTRTDIFACAISHAGISDITGYWGSGYWGYTYGQVAEYGSYPWNNPDLFVKHSPLYNADKIHTPLLLLHGSKDTNVPPEQSQAMYTALKILKRPVVYVSIKDQDHHILDWNKRMSWQQIINAWFDMWLKEEPLWWDTLYPEDRFLP